MGTLLYVFGGALMICDPHAMKAYSESPCIAGALISFIGAGFGAIAIVEIGKLPSDLPLSAKLCWPFMF